MNVFLYVRVSTEEQSRSGLSLETQEKALKEYCERNNHTIIDIYRDAGFSARKPYNKRPEMMRLISDLKERKPQKILFTKLDRWFRNIREYYKVQEILDAHDVAWSAIWENYNTDTASGRLHVNIMLSVAQDESDRTSERIKSIHHAAIMRGQPISGIQPIGFKVDVIDGKKRVVHDPDQSTMLIELIEQFELHQSLHVVTRYINTKYNRVSAPANYKKILTNPMLYGKYKDNDNYTEPYITKERFDDLQQIIQRNIRVSEKRRTYLFSGLIRCPVCGCVLGGCYDGARMYYRCRKRYNATCESKHNVNELRIERYLLDNIRDLFDDYRIRWTVKESRQRREDPEKYKKQLERLNDVYIDGNITKEQYRQRTKALKDKIAELNRSDHGSLQLSKLKNLLTSDFEHDYNLLDREHKRSFWRQLIKQIVVDFGGHPVDVIFLD